MEKCGCNCGRGVISFRDSESTFFEDHGLLYFTIILSTVLNCGCGFYYIVDP